MSQPGVNGFEPMGAGPKYQDELAGILAELPMFSDFDWIEVKELAKYMSAYRVKPGTVVFREGDEGSFMGLVVEGRIDILKEDCRMDNQVVAVVGPGKTLGEMALIDGERRSATGVASEASVLALLTRENFGHVTRDHPGLGVKILLKIARLLSQRLRYTSGLLVDYLGH